jgi:cytochrome c oxidase subunit 4
MATVPGTAPRAGETAHAGDDHASIGTYVKVAAILCVITGLEYTALFIRRLTPILVPLLISMSVAKFALVALFFMHLRYDSRTLGFIFGAALLLAIGLGVALVTLNGQFLVFGR